MKSKTLIEKQAKRKLNPELVETVRLAKKNKGWLTVAGVLAGPRRNRPQVNLDQINSKEGNVVVPGKVLSQGDISKKKIVAFNFSGKAKEKIEGAGGKAISIKEEIKSNPEMKGLSMVK